MNPNIPTWLAELVAVVAVLGGLATIYSVSKASRKEKIKIDAEIKTAEIDGKELLRNQMEEEVRLIEQIDSGYPEIQTRKARKVRRLIVDYEASYDENDKKRLCDLRETHRADQSRYQARLASLHQQQSSGKSKLSH